MGSRLRGSLVVLLAPIIWVLAAPSVTAQTVVGHASTNLDSVPQAWIEAAAENIHVAFNHTSHGSQLINGMDALAAYPAFGDTYAWSVDGSSGLHLAYEGIPCSVPDLSEGDWIDEHGVTPWVTCTRHFLNDPANSHFNVVMWSWCSINGHDAQRYVDNMEILVGEYPSVHFVFMTGHAEGQGETSPPGSVHANNQLIRQHCEANERLLYDFADIEAYDPDGVYFWDRNMWDNLSYDGGNWAVEWIAANPGSELANLTTGDGVEDYYGVQYCAHSMDPSDSRLNCVLKGRAAWWLFARLAGWQPENTLRFRRPSRRVIPVGWPSRTASR